jgi:hypothetical protein
MAQNPQELVRQGIEAARNNDKLTARRLLQQALSYDPDNEVAWMWMASVVDTVEERRRCLERVLRINPNNTRAQEALTRLGGTIPARAAGDVPRPAGGATPNPRVARPVDRSQRRGGLNIYLIAAGIVGIVVIGVVVASFINQRGITIGLPAPPTSNLDATFQAAFTIPTLTLTPTNVPPATANSIIVTPRFETLAAQFPPTFTPTFTPTPTETPTPTITPFPLSVYPILYADFPAQRTVSSLYRGLADGSDETELALGGFDDVALDPQGVMIAFVRTFTETAPDGTSTSTQELFIAPISDPTNAVQVTTLNTPTLRRPSWSDDSRALVFASDAGRDLDLYIVEVDARGNPTRDPRAITDNDIADDYPHWSSDGTLIVFASEAEGAGLFEIYTIEPNGDNLTRLTNASGSNFAPRWSPTMDRIAFVTDRGGQRDIYLMEPNGDSQRLLTFGDGDANSDLPAWSPDGSQIAFASDRPVAGRLPKFNWYVMDARGENVQSITINTRAPQSLVFFPTLRVR